jgi:hypothetical protein
MQTQTYSPRFYKMRFSVGRREMTWTRAYVAALGDDATNHVHAIRLLRAEYPGEKVLCLEISEVRS